MLLNIYFTGTAGESLNYHIGMKFATQDVDNDLSSGNCAQVFHGAWWFKHCFSAHLNGEYIEGRHNRNSQGAIWDTFKGWYYSYKTTEMKAGPGEI